MEHKKFRPKGRDELKTEILANYGIDYDANQELVDKMIEDRFKDEEFKAAEKNKTAKARELLDDMTRAKEFYKKGGKPKGAKEPKQADPSLSLEDKAYLFGRGYTRTEVRHLEKVMKITKKPWDKAISDSLFTSWKRDNDILIQRRGSSLGASRGGGSGKEKTNEEEMTNKFSSGLPKGFKFTPKKK